MEASPQKVAVMKRRQLIIRAQHLQRFKDSVKSSSRPIQRAGSMHAPQGTNENRYPSISDNSNRKRKEAQEPSTHPQQNPNDKQANEAEPTNAENN